MISLF